MRWRRLLLSARLVTGRQRAGGDGHTCHQPIEHGVLQRRLLIDAERMGTSVGRLVLGEQLVSRVVHRPHGARVRRGLHLAERGRDGNRVGRSGEPARLKVCDHLSFAPREHVVADVEVRRKVLLLKLDDALHRSEQTRPGLTQQPAQQVVDSVGGEGQQ